MRARGPRHLQLLCLLSLVAACDGPEPSRDAGPDDAGMDAGRPRDASFDSAAPRDAAGSSDAAPIADAGPRSDGGTAPRATACDPVSGIECDGDWMGQCSPACADTECCIPLAGGVPLRRSSNFHCAPRDDDGTCPAADIWVDTDRLAASVSIVWQSFDAAGCEVGEACVDAPGWRRLLKFDTWTPNTGAADLYLGSPSDHPDVFQWSDCHGHYHFNSYARYAIFDADGDVVARGHKQAFCLEDFYHYPGTDNTNPVYDCTNQGLEAGWQDVYGSYLDCQWVDITGVAPGTYTLRVELNYEGVLLESDYSNDVGETTIVIGDDVTAPCPDGTRGSADRDCGLTREGVHTCTPGESLQVGCSSICELGTCTGDPFLRVCEVDHDPACSTPFALATNDDSGCTGARCGTVGGDCCPMTTFTCPDSGQFVVFYAAYDPADTITCDVAVQPAP